MRRRVLLPLSVVAAFGLAALASPVGPPESALAQPAPYEQGGGDPPARVGRLSAIVGTVSFHAGDDAEWEPAALNYPLTTGNGLWTEAGGRTRIDLGAAAMALDSRTEIRFTNLDDALIRATLAQGSLYLRIDALDPNLAYVIDTAEGSVQITGPGRAHLDAADGTAPATLSLLAGAAQLLYADGRPPLPLAAGQVFVLTTSEAPSLIGQAAAQPLDGWGDERPAPPPRAPSEIYVSPEIPGAADVTGIGDWQRTPDYGTVWYPPVAPDWAPYRYGHWAFIAPWGWTWVDDAPWGFAPFHYGRWIEIGPRWAWVPGSPTVTPVYAPALVAFIGAPAVAVGVAAGAGYVGWVPLGPREVFVPTYRASFTYIREVNVAHVREIDETVIVRERERRVSTFTNYRAATVVEPRTMVESRPVRREAIRIPETQLGQARVQTAGAPVKPSLATRGASPAVVRAVGGVTSGAAARSPAPAPAARPAAAATSLSPPARPNSPTRPAVQAAPAAPRPQARPQPGAQPTPAAPKPPSGQPAARPAGQPAPAAPRPPTQPSPQRAAQPAPAAPKPPQGQPAARPAGQPAPAAPRPPTQPSAQPAPGAPKPPQGQQPAQRSAQPVPAAPRPPQAQPPARPATQAAPTPPRPPQARPPATQPAPAKPPPAQAPQRQPPSPQQRPAETKGESKKCDPQTQKCP